MENLIYKFIQQMEEAMIIAESSKISDFKPDKIFITGMGGSGIAGRFTMEIMKKYSKVPVLVSNNYEIPGWIDEKTLSIVSSYSGNTEETLTAFNSLLKTGSRIIALTSGGQLLKDAAEKKIDHIKIPGDWPAPRACIGYSLIFQLFLLYKLEILDLELPRELSLAIDILLKERENINIEAQTIAKLMSGRLPVIYSDQMFEPMAIRFRQQLNENSKMLAFNSVFPEMNHNEIAAWVQNYKDLACIFIKSDLYSEEVNRRIDISKEIMINHADAMIDINSKGHTLLQQIFYLIHLTDWISWYLAGLNKVNAMEIANIDLLKSRLQNK